jgi:hypothetical protein
VRNKIFGSRPVSRPASDPRRSQNRPDWADKIPRQVMFTTAGPTGWRRRRDLRGHKGNMKEGDFSHLHDKFTEEEA